MYCIQRDWKYRKRVNTYRKKVSLASVPTPFFVNYLTKLSLFSVLPYTRDNKIRTSLVHWHLDFYHNEKRTVIVRERVVRNVFWLWLLYERCYTSCPEETAPRDGLRLLYREFFFSYKFYSYYLTLYFPAFMTRFQQPRLLITIIKSNSKFNFSDQEFYQFLSLQKSYVA